MKKTQPVGSAFSISPLITIQYLALQSQAGNHLLIQR
jgi:hypothetical protein